MTIDYPRYHKLSDGSFGVAGRPDQLQEGAEVDVHTRDGSVRTERLGALIDTDPENNLALFATDRSKRVVWRKDGESFYLYGPKDVLVPGAKVTVHSRSGPEEQVVAAVADRTTGDPDFILAQPQRARFVKLGNDFLIVGRGLEEGATVTVRKKDGSTSEEKLGARVEDRDDGETAHSIIRQRRSGGFRQGANTGANTGAGAGAPGDADDVYEE